MALEEGVDELILHDSCYSQDNHLWDLVNEVVAMAEQEG